MRAKVYYIIFSISLFWAGCSSYESVYQSNPLEIDGSSSDWETTLDSKKSHDITYGVSNDTSNLYVRLHIIEQDFQMKILLAGLTVWIDTTGKSKEILGISCPLKKAPPKMDRNEMNFMRERPKWNNTQILEAEFMGFEEVGQVYYVNDNPFGVEISMNQDEFKSMYYELKIPFSSIGLNANNYLSKPLSIGIETGSIDIPTPKNMQASMRPGGNMGGRTGGMARGGMGGKPGGMSGQRPNMETMNNLKTPTKFWIKNIKLAKE